MPDAQLSIHLTLEFWSEQESTILNALPVGGREWLGPVQAGMADLDLTMPEAALPEFLNRLKHADPQLADVVEGAFSLARPAAPSAREERREVNREAPRPTAAETSLLERFQWLIPPRDRPDIIADLEDDAQQMRERGCSQVFIILCLLWHLVVCLAQYVRSPLSPKTPPRDPS